MSNPLRNIGALGSNVGTSGGRGAGGFGSPVKSVNRFEVADSSKSNSVDAAGRD